MFISPQIKLATLCGMTLLFAATTSQASLATSPATVTTTTLENSENTTLTVPAKDLPLLTQKLSSATLGTIKSAETRMRMNTLPKWLTPEQKTKLDAMTPEEASKTMIQWSEEYMEKRNQMDEKDKAVKQMLEKSRLKQKQGKAPKPIFTAKEQAKFAKMTDKEREAFLKSKGIRVHIEREKTSATISERMTSEALALMAGAPMMGFADKGTTEILDANDPNVISVKDDKSSMVIKVRTSNKKETLKKEIKAKSK